MFLTTNRVDAIDDAFRSRIDLILTYPNLDHAARRQIWSTFISSLPSGSCNIADIDFDELARTDMNGRDIKNVVKIASFRCRHGLILLTNRWVSSHFGEGLTYPHPGCS